ncbi:MAG: hypothetical protein Q8M00_02495 [bacterium]|nr:hypothetical protein [bacterium]
MSAKVVVTGTTPKLLPPDDNAKEGKVMVPYSRVTIADVEDFRRGGLVVECDGDKKVAVLQSAT